MIEIREMTSFEVEELLRSKGYGHLACSRDDKPYVIPINYAYDKPDFFIYTTDGKKSEILRTNPEVCLQVEQVDSDGSWRSVVVNGKARLVADPSEKARVMKLVIPDPALSPATGITWVDDRVCAKTGVVFRIEPETLSGRSADKVDVCAAAAQPASRRKSYIL